MHEQREQEWAAQNQAIEGQLAQGKMVSEQTAQGQSGLPRSLRLFAWSLGVAALLVTVTLLLHFNLDDTSAFAADEADGGQASLMLLSEDGLTRYSTDGGVTWTEGYPDGFSLDTDGQGGTLISADDAVVLDIRGLPSDAEGAETEYALRRAQDGEVEYSTDGGETWSSEVPEGLRVIEESDDILAISTGSSDSLIGSDESSNIALDSVVDADDIGNPHGN
ncbi:MAG: hypothetical protein LBO07_01445 [Coriobacteriales bacterium]|jgi:hypothetical protein|nr:hypothetical protein [Coriobacteriales bacterium]